MRHGELQGRVCSRQPSMQRSPIIWHLCSANWLPSLCTQIFTSKIDQKHQFKSANPKPNHTTKSKYKDESILPLGSHLSRRWETHQNGNKKRGEEAAQTNRISRWRRTWGYGRGSGETLITLNLRRASVWPVGLVQARAEWSQETFRPTAIWLEIMFSFARIRTHCGPFFFVVKNT